MLPIAVFPSGQVDFQGETFWPYLGGPGACFPENFENLTSQIGYNCICGISTAEKTSEKHTQSEKLCFLKIFRTILNFVRNLTFLGVL